LQAVGPDARRESDKGKITAEMKRKKGQPGEGRKGTRKKIGYSRGKSVREFGGKRPKSEGEVKGEN